MSRPNTDNPRLAALGMLASVLDQGGNLADADLENRQKDARDRAFARHLSYGVLRWLTALEWLASGLLRKPLRRKEREIQRLILIGLFQLWQDGDADHAAINETAECARKIGKAWAVPLINAVLRRFQREQQQWLNRLSREGARFAHPGWLLQALQQDWPDHWREIVQANQQPGALWLRLNARFDRAETLEELTSGGFDHSSHPLSGSAVSVSPAVPVNRLPGFGEGRFSVQDPAAQLAAGLLQAEPGHRVLDACSAPGGKACHLLESQPGIELTALDSSESRLALVRENLERLGFMGRDGLQLRVANAAEPDDWWNGEPYDRILLDAPCSATGVIRRHPEIKWLRSPAQVRQAAEAQGELLQRLWPLLKPGGILVYATCSVLKLENNQQIHAFTDFHPDAAEAPVDGSWGIPLEHGRQILPGELGMDGFYYARLQKST